MIIYIQNRIVLLKRLRSYKITPKSIKFTHTLKNNELKACYGFFVFVKRQSNYTVNV